MRHETIKDFRARIAALARGGEPHKPAYEAPQMDAATIMADLKAGIVRPGREVRGPRPPSAVRATNHATGRVAMVPRGGAALQIYQRRMWGDL